MIKAPPPGSKIPFAPSIVLDSDAKEHYVPSPMYTFLYNILLAFAAAFLVPYYGAKIALRGKYRKSIGPKFGFAPASQGEDIKGTPRIWVHAVSVGEVTAAAPIVAALRDRFPLAAIVLSTSTETGQEMARKTIKGATAFIYFPLDIPFVIRKVLNRVRPDIVIPVETEVWPNFIRLCGERGVKVLMVNGRLSPRSFKRYRKTRFFWKGILRNIDEIGTISETDAHRFRTLGADFTRVRVMGNAKYDSLAARAEQALRDEIADKLNIPSDTQVFVAGSTHEGEERVVLSVWRRLLPEYPDLLLILVPRHVERADEVLRLLRDEGFSDSITMAEIESGKRRKDERIIVVDMIGELFRVYSLATVVYCGGSLVPKGGQNILEPASWGKVVLYGPSMEDFVDEKESLEAAGAGIQVAGERELFEGIEVLMKDPGSRKKRGNAGKAIVAANRGASGRYAGMVADALTRDDQSKKAG
jgi:3-deoxy-D-manno-octulosonic-acid transferase